MSSSPVIPSGVREAGNSSFLPARQGSWAKRNHTGAMLRQFFQHNRSAGFLRKRFLSQANAEMPQRRQLAQVAVAGYIFRQQYQRRNRGTVIPSGEPAAL